MKLESLHDLLILKIQSLYDIETQLVKALPKMAKNATEDSVRELFETHLKETEEHVTRLEEVFMAMDEKPKKQKCESIRGLIADTEWIFDQDCSEGVLDVLLVSSARYVEHLEMAGYLSAITWAQALGLADVAELLSATLVEERNADTLLSEATDFLLDDNTFGEPDDSDVE